jgi:hypothetical protein
MKNSIKGAMLAALAAAAFTIQTHAQELDEDLKVFAPLVGTTWEGHFQDSLEADPAITLSFESMLAGKAVRLVSGGFGMTRENLHYWDPEKKQICYVALTSNGWVSTGTVVAEGTVIATVGRQAGPDGTAREVKNTWELTADGELIARGYAMVNGAWEPGHVIVFTARSPAASDKR